MHWFAIFRGLPLKSLADQQERTYIGSVRVLDEVLKDLSVMMDDRDGWWQGESVREISTVRAS